MAGVDMAFIGPTSEFPALMTDQLTSMRDNGTLTDFIITAESRESKLPCHKVILAIHSPYLRAMFTTDMVEAAKNTVHYDDISLNTMKLVLDYCYHEHIGFPSNQFIPLITASDYLQIERLKKRCVIEVKTFLNPENVLEYLAFAGDQHLKNLEDIKTWCLEIIVKSFSDVSKQAAFLALTYDVLQECVKAVIPSDVHRDEVLSAVFRWVNDNPESHGKHLGDLLHQVQLDKCSLPAILDVMIAYKTMIANCKVLGLLIDSVTKHTANIKTSTDPAKDKTFLNPENVLQYLTFAGENSLQDLKTWCLEIVVTSFPDMYKQAAFISLSYAELQDCMCEVVRSEVASDEALRAVLKWVDDNAESRGKHLEELLKMVQLDHCSLPAIIDAMDANETVIASNVKVFSMLAKAAKQQTAKVEESTKQAKAKLSVKTLVIAGGTVGSNVNRTCWSLNTKEKTFTSSFSVPFDELAGGHSICEIPEGLALTGGNGSDMCVLFVASTQSWLKMAQMKRKRCAHGSIYIKGILYVVCGNISYNKSASVDCLTLSGGQWESLPDCPVAAYFPLLAELNGKLYMLEHQITNQLFEFDVDTKEWKERASLPGEASLGASMIAVNGQLCVAGGIKRICTWYNPATNMWRMSEQRPSKIHRFGSLVQVDANTLLLLGGSYSTGTDAIEELNIEDGRWSVKELCMPAKLDAHKALLLDIPQQISGDTE